MRARRRLAQHFLEPAWVRKAVEAIAPQAGEVFVEIGPGRGALTLALAAHDVTVTAVELDRDLAVQLAAVAPPNVRLVQGDVLRTDLVTLVDDALARAPGTASGGPARRARVVGNLPYNISSPILLKLAALARATDRVADATLMLQEEVAARVVAAPGSGDFGPLAIAMQLRADARRLLGLPPGAFRPAPRVHSALLRLTFRGLLVEPGDERLFDALVRGVFTRRRKTLVNALVPFAHARHLDAARVVAAAGVDPRRRPETLSLDEFARLSRTVADAVL